MNVRRVLVPLLMIFSMLMAACGSPGTSTTDSADASNGAAASEAAASEAADASEAAGASEAAASDNSGAAPQSGEAIDFRMAWWGSQNRHDRTIKALDLFKQDNPNVNITYEFAAFGDYWTKLTTQAAGGNVPCLIQQDYAYLDEWVSRGLLLPLDDYITDGTIDTTNIDPAYLEGGRIDDKVYAISMGTNTMSMVMDTQMFEEAGVEIPSEDWTWQDFEQTMTQLKEKTGVYGHSTGLTSSQVFKLWLKQHGVTYYNAEGTALGYEDDQLYVDFFNMLKGWMDKGLVPNREFEVAQGEVSIEDNPLAKQEAAMGFLHSNQIVAVASANGGRPLQALPFPNLDAPDAKEGNYLKPSQFLSVTANCDHPEVAAQLINFFTNDLEANDVLAAERGVPISTEVREYLQPKVEPAQQAAFDVVAQVEENPSPLDPPDPAGHTEVEADAYVPLMDQVLYGQLSAEEAAPQFREQANAILSQNQ